MTARRHDVPRATADRQAPPLRIFRRERHARAGSGYGLLSGRAAAGRRPYRESFRGLPVSYSHPRAGVGRTRNPARRARSAGWVNRVRRESAPDDEVAAWPTETTGPGPGRPKGSRPTPAKRWPAIKKKQVKNLEAEKRRGTRSHDCRGRPRTTAADDASLSGVEFSTSLSCRHQES
ncbi:hypothetical protein Aph02nite_43580 [Actinoplanes philippinensis]|nr:hypothetical protein Aph02nite_43580 [Actinoplanes philippinensis]